VFKETITVELYLGVSRVFPKGESVDILLVLARLLPMQCKWAFTIPFLHHKEKAQCYDEGHKGVLSWQQ